MINENRVSKYLVYAIGEIVLVVIGILIALQVNNWNEKRVLASETKLRLSKLVNDLEEDQYQLYNIQDQYALKFAALQYLFKMANVDPYYSSLDDFEVLLPKNSSTIPNTYDKDFIQKAFKWSARVNVELNNTNTYDELKSTGQFSYINNDTLRDQINTYYDRWEWLFDPIIEDLRRRWVYSLDEIGIMESNPFTIENPLSILTNNPERASILRRLTREIGWYAMSTIYLLEANAELIKSIKEEIKK